MPNPKFGRQTGRTRNNRKVVRPLVLLPRILIVCQGEKTEPSYFRSFKAADVEVKFGNGDPSQVVSFAEERHNENPQRDAVWCVFDKDDFPQFDAAVERVKILNQQKQPFFVAWSNICFELWYILHFEYLQSAIHRKDYGDKISGHLKFSYKKNDETIRDHLQIHEDAAFRNAEGLRRMHEANGTTLPSLCCPMTTVDELVRLLRQARSR